MKEQITIKDEDKVVYVLMIQEDYRDVIDRQDGMSMETSDDPHELLKNKLGRFLKEVKYDKDRLFKEYWTHTFDDGMTVEYLSVWYYPDKYTDDMIQNVYSAWPVIVK